MDIASRIERSLCRGAAQPRYFNDEWDWCSGYHISDSSIMGFSHTHLSGTGCGDLLDFLVMAGVGAVKLVPDLARTRPGVSVEILARDEVSSRLLFGSAQRPNVRVELTSTERTGIHAIRSGKRRCVAHRRFKHSYLTRGESSVYSAELTQPAPTRWPERM